MEAEVVFLCKRTAVSSQSMWPGELRQLSPLDCAMERYRIRAVYYYSRCPPASGIGSSTGDLKESLAVLLNTFRVIAGRLQRTAEGRWAVKCNDAGVRMVEATAKGSVEEWLREVDREKEMKLAFWEGMYDRVRFWATFYIQLTRFEGGGMAIGISCAHMVADAVSLSAVMTAWADMNRQGEMLSPPSFNPLPLRAAGDSPRSRLIDLFLSPTDKKSTETGGFPTATFAFSDEAVESILAEAHAERGAATGPNVFSALAALFWAAISRAKGMGKEKGRGLIDMAVCVDARGALKLSRSFFGNAMVFAGVHGGGIKDGTLAAAAKAVADAVSEISCEGVMGMVEWLDGLLGEGAGPAPMLCGKRLLCANWEGLNTHSAAFERGAPPVQVSYYLEPLNGEGQILVLRPPSQGEPSLARVVAVTLPEHQLARLCEDGLILRYQRAISMNRSRVNI